MSAHTPFFSGEVMIRAEEFQVGFAAVQDFRIGPPGGVKDHLNIGGLLRMK